MRVNDTPARPDIKVYENFTVSWDMNAGWAFHSEAVLDDAEEEEEEREAQETQEREMQTTSGPAEVSAKKEPKAAGREVQVLANGRLVSLSGKANYVFVDIFDFIDFDLKDSRGRTIVTLLNGRNADYMEGISDGDSIEIYWEESEKKS